MHDLNDALDELRSVIPYAHGPSVRKLSKIATLLLAKNYILMQARALDELRRLVGYMNQTAAAAAVGVAGVGGIQPRSSMATGAIRQPPSSAAAAAGTSVIGGGSSLSDVYSGAPPDVVSATGGACYANAAGECVSREGNEDANTEARRLASNYSPS